VLKRHVVDGLLGREGERFVVVKQLEGRALERRDASRGQWQWQGLHEWKGH